MATNIEIAQMYLAIASASVFVVLYLAIKLRLV